jgi:hypothetical protein
MICVCETLSALSNVRDYDLGLATAHSQPNLSKMAIELGCTSAKSWIRIHSQSRKGLVMVTYSLAFSPAVLLEVYVACSAKPYSTQNF